MLILLIITLKSTNLDLENGSYKLIMGLAMLHDNYKKAKLQNFW